MEYSWYEKEEINKMNDYKVINGNGRYWNEDSILDEKYGSDVETNFNLIPSGLMTDISSNGELTYCEEYE